MGLNEMSDCQHEDPTFGRQASGHRAVPAAREAASYLDTPQMNNCVEGPGVLAMGIFETKVPMQVPSQIAARGLLQAIGRCPDLLVSSGGGDLPS